MHFSFQPCQMVSWNFTPWHDSAQNSVFSATFQLLACQATAGQALPMSCQVHVGCSHTRTGAKRGLACLACKCIPMCSHVCKRVAFSCVLYCACKCTCMRMHSVHTRACECITQQGPTAPLLRCVCRRVNDAGWIRCEIFTHHFTASTPPTVLQLHSQHTTTL